MPFVSNKNSPSTITQQLVVDKLSPDVDQTALLFGALFGANILAPSSAPNDTIASELSTTNSLNDVPSADTDDAVVLQQAVPAFLQSVQPVKDKAQPAVDQEGQGTLRGVPLTETDVVNEPEWIIANPLVAADILLRPELGTMAGPTRTTSGLARSAAMPMVSLAFEGSSPEPGNVTTPRLLAASLTEEPAINDSLRLPQSPARGAQLQQKFMAESRDVSGMFTDKLVQQTEPSNVTDEVINPAMPKSEMSVPVATGGMDTYSNDAGRKVMSLAGQVVGQGGQQNSQQNAGQSSGGSNYSFGATSQMSHENMMEMLDMAQDNWTEMLLNRVETSLAGGKEKLEFLLNPRNLGKMKVTLGLHNDRTIVQINTETAAAAALIAESEGRLAQLMESSGLKLGQFNATQDQSGQGSMTHHHARGQGNPNSTPGSKTVDQQGGDTNQSNGGQTHVSDHLINLQA